MISVDNVHISLGGRPVLQGVNLSIREGECLAVVGPNGCGKSTLLRAIAGLERPDTGEVRLPNRMTVGFLPQEVDLDVEHPVQEELLDAFVEVQSALEEMAVLEQQMGKTDPDSQEHKAVLRRYAECSHFVEHHDGYALEAQTQRVAAGLGFSPGDMSRSCREFSGGWQMRILLSKLLLRKPDLILLDEPTNHLDLESTLWLEQWIKGCGRTVVLVSHERAMMDRLTDRIVCLEQGKADVYTGDYSNYLVQSDRKRQEQWDAYERQHKQIAAVEAFIKRFRANARRASLVQSRIKQLEKIERIEPPFHPTAIHFDFPAAPRSYRDVVTLTGLGHAYGECRVFSGINLTVHRGDKVGLVGVNGAGKSTLLRIIAGQEKPTEGECSIGRKVNAIHFAQYDTATLDSDTTLLAAIEATAPPGQAQRARDLLGAFLFTGDDGQKPLRVLSGGERTRFRLAQILFSPANLLLLDEPTNHLDVSSRATVEKALQAYTGTVVVVSHDRVFMDRVTDRIVEIENGSIQAYPGKYSDYLVHKEELIAAARKEESTVRRESARVPDTKEQRVREREERRTRTRRLRATERKIEGIEQEIERHEARLAELDETMADPLVAADYDRLGPLSDEHRRLTEEHHELLEEWHTLHEELQALKNQDGLESETGPAGEGRP